VHCYAGRTVTVDLGDRRVEQAPLSEELVSSYVGARGINAKHLYDLVDASADPLGGENYVIVGAGALSGTTAPSSGRTTLTTKSPATGIYLKGSVGGHFSLALKFAGFDELLLTGVSQKPVVLVIRDGVAELIERPDLWGRDVRETEAVVKGDYGHDVSTLIIGPAGEKGVKFASVMSDIYSAAGRGGIGAVLGSKRLKAIVVGGTGSISVAEPERFRALARKMRIALSQDTRAQTLYKYGVAGILGRSNELCRLPTYNFQRNHIEGASCLTGQNLVQAGYLKGRKGCSACSISCHRYCEVAEGQDTDSFSGGPEFETLAALGTGTAVLDVRTVLKANELCNILGLDTASTGSVIQWTMEAYERGAIGKEELEDLEPRFGNTDALVPLIEMIAARKGFGDVLAEGVRVASQTIGGESWKWAVHAKGLEQTMVDTRVSKAYALGFAVNPRGSDHLHTQAAAECGGTPEAVDAIRRITGSAEYATPLSCEKRAEIIRWHEDIYAMCDALGICSFTTTYAYGLTPETLAELYSCGTGKAYAAEELMQIGRRIVTLEKCFNVRLGMTREDDRLPWRVMNEPTCEGPSAGMRNDPAELEKMKDEYYALHGWDNSTGAPTRKILEELGLEEVGRELEL